MNIEFVQEIVEEDGQLRMGLTGWEKIVFELEDDQDVEPRLQQVGAS